jgi:hypothetical protein
MTVMTKRLGQAFGLALILGSPAAANEIYQWTDVKGVIHFADSLNWVPETARNSSSFVVRKDLDNTSKITELPHRTPEPIVNPEAAPLLEPMPNRTDPTSVVYASQEVTIVVVNSATRHFKRRPCSHCKPVFRPDFNNRQYIHPSVFNGGSRQYVYPR